MKCNVSIPTIPSFVTTQLLPLLNTHRIFTLSGPLGAGKTTLTKELLKQCGITEVVTSPTFSYVNTYKNAQGRTFYHFDLYRLNSVDDFVAMGFDEYLNQPDAFCLIEWPGVIAELLNALTDSVKAITIAHNPEKPDERSIEIR